MSIEHTFRGTVGVTALVAGVWFAAGCASNDGGSVAKSPAPPALVSLLDEPTPVPAEPAPTPVEPAKVEKPEPKPEETAKTVPAAKEEVAPVAEKSAPQSKPAAEPAKG